MTNSLFVVFSHRFRRVVTCDSFGEKKRFRTIDAAIWKFTHIHHWNRKKYEENICDRFGCMRIDCALDNAELPASLWVIEEPIVKRKTKMVFLFFFGKERKEKKQHRGENKPHICIVSPAIFSGESYDRNQFSPQSGSRASVETGTIWNIARSPVKHLELSCQWMNVVLRFNLFEKEQWAKLCIESEPKKNNWNLEKPKQRNGVLSGTPIVSFSKCIMTIQVRQWTLPPRFIAQNTGCGKKKQRVRDLVTSRGLLLQAKTTSSFVFSYRPSEADLRFFFFLSKGKFLSLKRR